MLKINATTVIIASPGDDREFGTADDGVWHCFKLGTSGQDCEFLDTGGLYTRRAILVSATTAVVVGKGADEDDCESLSENTGNPDDLLLVLRKLGKAGATVEAVDGAGLEAGGLCFGAIASDPIRINNGTVLFNQPGADVDYAGGGSECVDPIDPDDTVVVAKIGTTSTTLKEILVGSTLGVHLTGAPASLPVRVGDAIAVIASPGEDSQFADGSDGCDTPDDGLIVVKGLSGTTYTASFNEIGTLAANPSNRPVLVNPGKAVVVLGTGPSQKQQEEELEDNGCCVLSDDNVSDDEIHVVNNLAGAPSVTTFGNFGYFRGPPRVLNSTTVVAFEEDHSLAIGDDTGFREDLVRLNVHRIKGIGATPSQTIIPLPNGDAFHRDVHSVLGGSNAIAMNGTQMMFHVTGPPQVYLLNDGPAPFLTGAGGEADEWAEVKLTRLGPTIAGYTRAKEGGVGAIRIKLGGRLENRLVTLSQEGDDRSDNSGTNQPASQPVRITPYRFVVAQGGSNNSFADDENELLNGHDDGFIVVNTFIWPPAFKFVTVRNACGGAGCKPLALGTDTAPMIAILGVGDNGEFDNDGDETDDDDEINVIKGF
jgi:hypothetical protein